MLFALSRYGGLRCPSEHLALRWGDLDWDGGRFTVHASKTEHHEGAGIRVVPIFPELRPYLEAAWDEAPEGTEFVITRYRHANVNLRTQLLKILKRAGVKPWPRLFHNLRATRQTELAAVHPLHVVCEWIGNSKLIAQEHYLRVTDADFNLAQKAAQSPAQQPSEIGGNRSQGEPSEREKSPENAVFSGDSDESKLDDTGLERMQKTREKQRFRVKTTRIPTRATMISTRIWPGWWTPGRH